MPETFVVPTDAPEHEEPMGARSKFWFTRDAERWMFKLIRPDSGEDWAEIAAAEAAAALGLPHATYQLATFRDQPGVVTRSFSPKGFALVHGNELLHREDPEYPSPTDGSSFVRVQKHTVEAVHAVLTHAAIRLPLDWIPPPSIATAGQVFAGYLLLDAWIGNTDRHHKNWGLLVDAVADARHLAPTFDHPSSLGSHLVDAERSARMTTRDAGYSVDGYVVSAKARSAFFRRAEDRRPLTMLEALRDWQGICPAPIWQERLASIDDGAIHDLIGRLAGPGVAGPALAFAEAILRVNRRRILEEP